MTDTEVTDTITVGDTKGRRWVWQAEPLAEDVVTFGTLPDPRDARIAELEAALREIKHWCEIAIIPPFTLKAIQELAIATLMPSPERDMTITTEELSA